MERPRHPVKELEAVLRAAEEQGWRVQKRKKYFRMFCPAECLCMRSVHLTPSSNTYLKNLQMWLRRCPCWREEGT